MLQFLECIWSFLPETLISKKIPPYYKKYLKVEHLIDIVGIDSICERYIDRGRRIDWWPLFEGLFPSVNDRPKFEEMIVFYNLYFKFLRQDDVEGKESENKEKQETKRTVLWAFFCEKVDFFPGHWRHCSNLSVKKRTYDQANSLWTRKYWGGKTHKLQIQSRPLPYNNTGNTPFNFEQHRIYGVLDRNL